jgi:hypothetical protein
MAFLLVAQTKIVLAPKARPQPVIARVFTPNPASERAGYFFARWLYCKAPSGEQVGNVGIVSRGRTTVVVMLAGPGSFADPKRWVAFLARKMDRMLEFRPDFPDPVEY